MKTILDCPRCEERNNCTMLCPGDVEPKTYLKSATADELSRNQVIRKSAAAPVPDSALASSGVAAPASRSYYVILVDGLFVSYLDPIRFDYSLTLSQSLARKFRTPLQLKYLGKFTDFLERHHRPFEIQVWRQEQSK